MSQKIPERLETLRKLNSNRQWVNDDLYRLMFKEDLYIIAYERIKSKPGNMTPGTDGETLNGLSMKTIGGIIEAMRTESFQFKPVRQSFIPKANGKMRKLGIPIVRSYCPPSRVLSGLRCRRRSADSIPARSTVPYFARAVGSVVVSNGAASACAAWQ